MLRGEHHRHRPVSHDLAICQYRDAVAYGVKAIEVMGDHENRQSQGLLQSPDQDVELPGRDRVKPGGRFVEKHDVRVEGKRARQCHALGHAARDLGGKLVAVPRIQPDHLELYGRELVEQCNGQAQIFPHRELDVLAYRERREQRALLEQNALAACNRACVRCGGALQAQPGEGDGACAFRDQADKGAQQHRFSTSRRADDTEDFAAAKRDRKPVQHDLIAESDHKIARLDHRLSGWGVHVVTFQ